MLHTVEIEVPDDVFVRGTVLIVSYFDENGNNGYQFKTAGDQAMSTYIGLCAIAQHDILKWNDRGE